MKGRSVDGASCLRQVPTASFGCDYDADGVHVNQNIANGCGGFGLQAAAWQISW